MRSGLSTFVTIEQLGVWVERREWFDQNEATQIGFSKATLDGIIEKHSSGAIHLSAIVDGSRRTLDPAEVGDFIFDVAWLHRAGLYLVGSHGNCEVRGRSIQAFLSDKIVDHSCRSDQLVYSPEQPAGDTGYHRVLRGVRVERKMAMSAWPTAPKPNGSMAVALHLRHEIMDALLMTASSAIFPKSASEICELIRLSASSLSSFSNRDLEQFISRECPRFWSWSQGCWGNAAEKEKASTTKPEAADYIFKKRNRLFFNWTLIEDNLLVNMAETGRPESHRALLDSIRKLISRGGPGRTESDRRFKRYGRFFEATAGMGIGDSAKVRRSTVPKAVRRAANRRSP
jgi:hypothetical protein